MGVFVSYEWYQDEFGGVNSPECFSDYVGAAVRQVAYICGGKTPSFDSDLVAYRRAICAAVDAFAEFGEGQAVSSIIFAGHDFGEYTSCEVIPQGFCGFEIESEIAAGRPGELVTERRLKPLTLQVKLFLDRGRVGDACLPVIRRNIAAWLADCPGTLVLPHEPDLTYFDVECTGCTSWSGPGYDAYCTVTFIAYDPLARKAAKSVSAQRSILKLTNCGKWAMPSAITVTVAAACEELVVSSGEYALRLGGTFAVDDVVLIDTYDGSVTLNGTDADTLIQLGSTMFWVEPGSVTVTCEQASSISVEYEERWP